MSLYSSGVYTVFPYDHNLLPQDFDTFDEALAFAEEYFEPFEYTIEFSS